jgi:hypothetical protein
VKNVGCSTDWTHHCDTIETDNDSWQFKICDNDHAT